MTLERILNSFGSVERSIVVVNRTEPEPIQNMLVDTFSGDAVSVREEHGVAEERPGSVLDHLSSDGGVAVDTELLAETDAVPVEDPDLQAVENLVLLMEDEEVVASSSLRELVNAILLVNSDLYITGTRTLDELELPDVITGLDGTSFTLQGYPESDKQKLLLITISRFIERAALEAGGGTLRSSFQRLSRLDDEVGTHRVYDRIGDAGVDAHVYGVPNEVPRDLEVVVHGGDSADFTDSWFVVFRPDDGPSAVDAADDLTRAVEGGVALLAVEVEDRIWRGMWTFDPHRVSRINRYVERNL